MSKATILPERLIVQAAAVPVNLAGQANDGAWVNIGKSLNVDIVLLAGAGGVGEDPIVTVEQAQDSAGTGAKALNFELVWKREAAAGNLITVGQYTRVQQAAANTYTSATGGENEIEIRVPIILSHLDVTNGFNWLRGRVADTGTTQKLGAIFYLMESRYGDQVLPSPLT